MGAVKRRPHVLDALLEEACDIDRLGTKWAHVSDSKLREQLGHYQSLFRRKKPGYEACLHEALAALREAAKRRTGLRPFVVQLAGVLALHRGYLAEMATGEGKTLTASLAGVLAGWTGRPCHIITVNDYLARRDAEWFKYLYQFCGLSVGHVSSRMEPIQRFHAYNQDITYTTCKEIVADFLRDRLRIGTLTNSSRRQIRYLLRPPVKTFDGIVMRGLHTAIVDEADSVLIDEAVTPVLISQPHDNPMLIQACKQAKELAQQLRHEEDYRINERYREIELTKSSYSKIDALSQGLTGLWRSRDRRQELIQQALCARELFIHGKQYVIQDGKVVIVDESTGRMMPQRTWREGLHQAIEAKEDLPLSKPGETLTRLSFQRFFRFYHALSGMTGTAQEAAKELWHIYHLPVLSIPTHKPCIRRESPDKVFVDQDQKWKAVVKEIIKKHISGRPILVGTRSVSESERLSELLSKTGLPFRVLNATRHQEEAQIVAEAGQSGRITVATNMAGRGTDIKLGRGVADLGGLHVLATNRYESHRIDRQLFGRSARQGDPGSAQAYVSLDDELLKRYVPPVTQRQVAKSMQRQTPTAEHQAIALFDSAQRSAQHQAYKQRLAVLKMDTWMEDALSFTGADSTA